MFWPSVFPTKNQSYIHNFQNFLATMYLGQVNQAYFSYRNYFALRWDAFKLIKNPFIKIKKQLMVTNFTLVTYKIAEKY